MWRWNSGGLGYSDTGYNGKFKTAITMKGEIVADFITAGVLNGALLKADSVQSSSISQSYKNEVTDEITGAKEEIEQSFTASDEQLRSIITSIDTVLTGDITEIEKNISTLQQTIENITFSFSQQTTGGINNIRNSSGLNGVSDDWLYTGEVVALQDAEAVNNTISGSMFKLSADNTLSQEIPLIQGTKNTL